MRVKVTVFSICIFFVILIQSTVLDYMKIYNVKPNLLIVFVISVALLNGNLLGALIGFIAGLSQDIVSGKMIGLYSLLGLYLGLIIGSVNKRLYRENLLVAVFFTFVSTIVYEWVVYFLNTFLKGEFLFLYPLRYVILPEAIYNSVISIFMYIFIIKLNDRFESIGKTQRKY